MGNTLVDVVAGGALTAPNSTTGSKSRTQKRARDSRRRSEPPWEAVVYFSMDEALRNPEHLDSLDWSAPYSFDVSRTAELDACWLTDTTTAVSGGDDEEEADDERSAGMLRLRPRGIVVYDTSTNAVLHSVVLEEMAGRLLAVDEAHAWPEISTSPKSGQTDDRSPRAVAFDRRTRRLAIAQDDGIHVIEC